MPVSVTMPRLGESVTEGTVTRWLKQEGEHVDADEPLLEVSTDKVDTEVPSPASGTVLSIKVQEDETVDIGVELAVIGDADEGASSDEGAAGGGDAAPEAEQAAPEPERQPEPEPEPEEKTENFDYVPMSQWGDEFE
jgi:pyruvate dehydrogenase E2 component (dihydrolipoamide acetyltransferase)